MPSTKLASTLVCALACGIVPFEVGAAELSDAGLQACRSIADPARRLACFDAIDAPAAQSPVAPLAPPTSVAPARPVESQQVVGSPTPPAPSAASQTPASPAAPPTRDGSFGSEQVITPIKPDAPKLLSARSIDRLDGIRKGQRITLDNGQVWLNVDDRSYDYEGATPEVRIERNFMGNYWMKLEDASFRFRVRRVK